MSEAYQELGPAIQTALARQPEPPLPCSEHLAPAADEQFRNELTACLSLVVPVGMTEESRRDWLAVAWGTLKHLPADLLAHGCAEARKTADHPSKIVPAITAYAEPRLRERQRFERHYPSDVPQLPPPRKHVADRDRSKFGPNDWRELNEHLERMGSAVRYLEDGTRQEAGG